jgi:hypothetical protein
MKKKVELDVAPRDENDRRQACKVSPILNKICPETGKMINVK